MLRSNSNFLFRRARTPGAPVRAGGAFTGLEAPPAFEARAGGCREGAACLLPAEMRFLFGNKFIPV
jgi:hypothetical protein